MKKVVVGLLVLLCAYLAFSLWSVNLKVARVQSDLNQCNGE